MFGIGSDTRALSHYAKVRSHEPVGSRRTRRSLARFFADLTRRQQTLVHVMLPETDLREERIQVIAAEGNVASWTLVTWH